MEKDNEKAFCDVFRKLRLEKGLSQDKISNELDVSQSLVNNWETYRSTPSPEMLEYIADYFNVSTDYLIGRTNDRRYFKKNDNNIEDFNILFDKYKTLSEDDKELIKNIIETRKKQIDKELGEN